MTERKEGRGEGQWEAAMPDGTPLLQACFMTEKVCKGATPDDEAEWGDTFHLGQIARKLLATKAYPETYNADGDTMLTYCLRTKRRRSAKILLYEFDADPNWPTARYSYALQGRRVSHH